MPRYGLESAHLFFAPGGADLMLGTVAHQIHDVARTDTYAADGEIWVYRSGATFVEQKFDAMAGAWRSHTLV